MAWQTVGQVWRHYAKKLAAWLNPETLVQLTEEGLKRRRAENQLTLRGRDAVEQENYRFNLEVESEKRGPRCPEFTVFNFTGFDLRMDGLLRRYSIPRGGEIFIRFDDRSYCASILRIREPLIYGKNVGAFQWGSDPGEAAPYRMAVCLNQAQIAASVLEKFNQRPVVNSFCPPKDARELPGIIAFMGSADRLQNALDQDGTLWIPVKSRFVRGSIELKEVAAISYFTEQMKNLGKPDEVALAIEQADERIG